MSNCTTIKIKVEDQQLILVQQPLVASGDVGTIRVEYDVDSFWEGFALSGTFYSKDKPQDIYEVPLVNGSCIIPWEVLQNKGYLYIGLVGVDATGCIKTSETISYNIEKGAARGTNTSVEPTPDVYQQILVEQAKLSEAIVDLEANMHQIEAPEVVLSVDYMPDTKKHYVNKQTKTIWTYMKYTKTTGGSNTPNFSNVFDADAAMIGYRWSGSASAPSTDNSVLANILSDFIPCDLSEGEHTLRIKNGYVHSSTNTNTSIVYFSSNDNDSDLRMVNYAKLTATEEDDGVFAYKLGDESGAMFSGYQNIRYIRVCFRQGNTAATLDNARNAIITIDEPITYTDVPESTETYYAWTDTGISYAPTFKTDLIGVLGEDNVIYLSDNLPSGTYTLKYGDDNYATVGTISK